MDGQRFDAFARALATGASRRGLLRGVVGAAFGGALVGLRGGGQTVAAQDTCSVPGDTCTSDSDCCVGSCSQDGVCYCTDPSRPIVGCPCDSANDQTCGGRPDLCCLDTGTCASPTVGCNPTGTCSAPGEDCSSDSDCCQGTCSNDGVCFCSDPSRPTVGCTCDAGDQNACGGRPDLCCSDGTCTSPGVGCNPTGSCAAPGDTCSADSDCCQGTCSQDGVCFCSDPDRPSVGCTCDANDSNACGGNADLCCDDGTCASPMVGCNPTGGGGNGGGDNSGGGNGGGGGTTTLPTTGSGTAAQDGDGLASWVAPAALAGAGAAALAAARQRRRESTAGEDQA